MKQPGYRGLVFFCLCSLALAACHPAGPSLTPTPAASTMQVWLDQPPDGAALPLGAFTLRAHARDAGGSGVETITFLVSSGGPPDTVGSVTTDPHSALVNADFAWTPPAAGAYTIQAQAFDHAGYVFSVPAHVCVGVAPAAGGACAAPAAAGTKLQGLVAADLNADGDAADAGEGPLAGALVNLSGCDTQSVHTNPPSTDPLYPEGVFAFGLASLSGCTIQVDLAGWRFESFEGSTAYPIAWPAEEAPHTVLMAPIGAATATATAAAAATAKATAALTTTPITSASATTTKTAQAGATATKKDASSPTPSATLANQAPPTDTPTITAPPATPSDTPKPSATQPPAATNTPAPSATPTLTAPPADTSPPAIAKVSAAPNPTFYGDACSKDQPQFTASAAVSDPSGVGGVTLFYRYGAKGSSGPWQSVGMSAAGGDQYSVNVHNDSAAVYKLLGGVDGSVEYYVQAQDKLGNTGQSPSQQITIQYCLG